MTPETTLFNLISKTAIETSTIERALFGLSVGDQILKDVGGDLVLYNYIIALVNFKGRLFDEGKSNPTRQELAEAVKDEHMHYFKSMCEVKRFKL